MARRTKQLRSEEANVDMTPMLDIVFIMLIFFIVSTSFLREIGIDITRPQASTKPNTNNAPPILIKVEANGDIWVDKRMVDVSRIPANIESLLTKRDVSQVLIDAHKDASHHKVMSVMDQVRHVEGMGISIVSK